MIEGTLRWESGRGALLFCFSELISCAVREILLRTRRILTVRDGRSRRHFRLLALRALRSWNAGSGCKY